MRTRHLWVKKISGYDFLLDKLEGRIYSAACEYVFSRDIYRKAGGFVKFPLAWCSDDATWTKFADCAGESLLCLESSFVGGMRKVKILVIPIAMIVGKLNLPGCS